MLQGKRAVKSTSDNRPQGFDQQPLLRRAILDGDVGAEPVLYHFADAVVAGACECAGVGEELQIGLAPAELGQLLGKGVVVGFVGSGVLDGASAALGNGLENCRHLRLKARVCALLLDEIDDCRTRLAL